MVGHANASDEHDRRGTCQVHDVYQAAEARLLLLCGGADADGFARRRCVEKPSTLAAPTQFVPCTIEPSVVVIVFMVVHGEPSSTGTSMHLLPAVLKMCFLCRTGGEMRILDLFVRHLSSIYIHGEFSAYCTVSASTCASRTLQYRVLAGRYLRFCSACASKAALFMAAA